jgi:hypothetical protein
MLAGAIALAVPAVVVAGFDPEDPLSGTFDAAERRVWTAENVATDDKKYRPIDDMPAPEAFLIDWVRPSTIQVSMDLKAGKARMRLVDENTVNPPEIEPQSVVFAGKGVSTATIVIRDGDLDLPVLEWKRLGEDEVKAASIIVDGIGHPD